MMVVGIVVVLMMTMLNKYGGCGGYGVRGGLMVNLAGW